MLTAEFIGVEAMSNTNTISKFDSSIVLEFVLYNYMDQTVEVSLLDFGFNSGRDLQLKPSFN